MRNSRPAISPVISSGIWVRSVWLGHANRLGPGAEERRVGVPGSVAGTAPHLCKDAPPRWAEEPDWQASHVPRTATKLPAVDATTIEGATGGWRGGFSKNPEI